MLTPDIVKKIEDFVHQKPRSVDEIAKMLNKNWRTADRYIDEIIKDIGTINTRVFREGTRGALKVVFYAGLEGASHSVFQKQLEEDIARGKTKYDFSTFDIYQYIPTGKKTAEYIKTKKDDAYNEKFAEKLLAAKNQVLFYSGNLSFINDRFNKGTLFDVIEELVKNKISVKVMCRVDFQGLKNIEKLLSLNHKYGKEYVEIRHRDQPLRGVVVDNKLVRLKEHIRSSDKKNEMSEDAHTFYTIHDKDWVEWLAKVFWKMFSFSISAKKRIDEIRKISEYN
jgi:hypothetical protein